MLMLYGNSILSQSQITIGDCTVQIHQCCHLPVWFD